MDSKELAKLIQVDHKKVMDFYWYLEAAIVNKRHLIKCTLVLEDGGQSWLKDISDAFILAAVCYFGKSHTLIYTNL